MKTYHSNSTSSTKEKRNFFVRNVYAILLIFTALVVGTVITLSLVLKTDTATPPGGNNNVIPPPPVEEIPVVVEPKFVLPVGTFTLGQEAALTKLVYSSTLNQWRTHNGVDFLAAEGTEVMCVIDGTVSNIKTTLLEGTVITITHKDGLESIYKSLSGTVTVAEGDAVKSGTVIGYASNSMTMEARVGSHLHLEMKLNGKLIDPLTKLPEITA